MFKISYLKVFIRSIHLQVKVVNSGKKKSKRYFDEQTENNDTESSDVKLSLNKPLKEEEDPSFEVIHVKLREKKRYNKFRSRSKFPGRAPIKEEALERHSRGTGISVDGVKTKTFKIKLKNKDKLLKFAEEQAARTELLLNEDDGFIEPDAGKSTANLSQKEILQHVDITSACKRFDLKLDFGPYRTRYTKNGRHLLLGGKMGHVAAFDWVRKKLHCEINVMEEVCDVAWLHVETMFAVAQKNWVHIYDNQGTELHCLKKLHRVIRMEYLPYHFLLATANDSGYLSWLDTSIGEFVTGFNAKCGRISMMTHNPINGVLCVGSSKGVVSMWSPNAQEPLAKMLCHPAALTSIAVDPKGMHLATSGADKTIKLWDIRELSGPIAEYRRLSASQLDISQKGVLAASTGDLCIIYKRPLDQETIPYLKQRCSTPISSLRFCPYEDVLGLGTRDGFQSILVPGCGEANYDGQEANPFQSKSQRREYEVHALLDKIPSELISLDPAKILEVDVPTLRDKIEKKKKMLHLKPEKINYEPRKKMKGKGGSANMTRNRAKLQEQSNRVNIFYFRLLLYY